MTALGDKLQSFVGQPCSEPLTAADPVNATMIRHWCAAIGHPQPGGDVAPEAMLQVWSDTGLGYPRSRADNKWAELLGLLESEGFTSVVATDSDQEFLLPVHLGDLLTSTKIIESISEEKQTALGAGYFVTTLSTYTNQRDEVVGRLRFRILKFAPSAKPQARRLRPRPAITRDNAFWFRAAKEGRLAIQRCASCRALRHPPGPACPHCRSFEWDTIDASGRATLHSFVVNHHPQVPAFDYPLVVGLVDLEEGTRLVTNLVEVDRDAVSIGMPLEVVFVAVDDDLTLPMFRPVNRGG